MERNTFWQSLAGGRVASWWPRREERLWAPHRFTRHRQVHVVLKVTFLPSCLSPASLLASCLPVQRWELPLFDLTWSLPPTPSSPPAPCQRACHLASFPGENQPTNLRLSNEPVKGHQSSVPVLLSISVLWYMVSLSAAGFWEPGRGAALGARLIQLPFH